MKRYLPFLLLLLTAVYWLLPIRGQVLIVPDDWQQGNAWPRVQIEPEQPRPGQQAAVLISDVVPWAHIKLEIPGAAVNYDGFEAYPQAGIWQWRWTFTVPNVPGYPLRFYHNCHEGCQEWAAVQVGRYAPPALPANLQPTKLGLVMPHPQRDWRGRSGWAVELTYATLPEEEYWGIDDLAERTRTAVANGQRVLVRVDYAQGQSVPPPDDPLALDAYLDYLRRLARDDRLRGVYGYILGSGFNDGPQAVTPEWYARIFNGYGLPLERTDTAVQAVRGVNGQARLLVGPVRPWAEAQNGSPPYEIDAPWLNYMHALVMALDTAAAERAAVGLSQAAPDGFALQTPGWTNAPQLADPANEPLTDLFHPDWPTAQAGFRVYQDWLAIINQFPHTQGKPVYITASNSYHPLSGLEPAQNYPAGWLTAALTAVNAEPQIAALCWFMDYFPHDDQWALFSLYQGRGLLVEAAAEFEGLLARPLGD